MHHALQRSLSLAGLRGAHALAPGGTREQIVEAARLGYRAVQLDAMGEGVRARDLDRSGRRDLASLLRRLDLKLSGLDLWVPPAHFVEPARADRAVAAVTQAVELASELAAALGPDPHSGWGGAVVSLSLPEKIAPDVVAHLRSAAALRGARIADHAWPVNIGGDGPIGIGLDPAGVIFAGADPAVEVSRLVAPPASARLSDLSPAGRVEPGGGEGSLDVLAYTVALSTKGYRGHLVVDLRGLLETRRVAAELAGAAI